MNFFNWLKKQTAPPPPIEITTSEWKNLLDESLSPLLLSDFGLSYLGSYTWAGTWENNRRKIIKLFTLKSHSGTLQWGWCFDFVPIPNANKLKYWRTNKSAKPHIWAISEDFHKGKVGTKEREDTMLRPCGLSHDADIAQCRAAYRHLKPQIEEYFRKTSDYSSINEHITEQLNSHYYKLLNGATLALSRSFIHALLGENADAIESLSTINFDEPWKKEAILEKLRQIQPSERTKLP